MLHTFKKFLITFIIINAGLSLSAQEIITGRLLSKQNGLPVADAYIVNLQAKTTTTSLGDGSFRISGIVGLNKLVIHHISYDTLKYELMLPSAGQAARLNLFLNEKTIHLAELSILASVARERTTPVAITTIPASVVENRMGNHNYPEILSRVPGIYATPLGGGTGDARLTIRGFQQENVALLLNGVPVGSVENGLIYWSNWAGLNDATQTIQVQRGLGAAKTAMNSVGGTINIITKGASVKQGGFIKLAVSDYGNRKISLGFSSGMSDNGISFSFLGSRTSGQGYVDATQVDAWSYHFSLHKDFKAHHKLTFTALGSPERHGQRNIGLTYHEYKNFGNRYNPNWGMLNGKINSVNENFYHKPILSLNHYWTIDRLSALYSAIYYSQGYGGGKFTEAMTGYPSTFSFRKNNQIDWDAIFLNNQSHSDTFALSDGTVIRGGFSKNIQTNYIASHYWAGFLSQFERRLNDRFVITSGIHGRKFRSSLREEISDLLGGSFWIEDYAWALAGVANRNQIKKRGDVIKVNNGAHIVFGQWFSQLEYKDESYSAFLVGSASSTSFQRTDPYNYPENPKSKVITKNGIDLKGGFNYNLSNSHNLYLNTGFNSREPLFKFVFVNFSNAVAKNLTNEKIISIEAGYRYSAQTTSVKVNLYHTYWKDKALLSYENIQLTDSSLTRSLVRGLNALHQGIETELTFNPVRNLTISTIASIGNWKWKNDVVAELYNDDQTFAGTTEVYARNLPVGDAPQSQVGIFVDYRLFDLLDIHANWSYYDRLYAHFDPASRNNPNDRRLPYKIPAYHMIDLHAGYSFTIGDYKAQALLICHNLMGKEHILRGTDGPSHTIDTFRGFWSFGRNFNFSLRLAW